MPMSGLSPTGEPTHFPSWRLLLSPRCPGTWESRCPLGTPPTEKARLEQMRQRPCPISPAPTVLEPHFQLESKYRNVQLEFQVSGMSRRDLGDTPHCHKHYLNINCALGAVLPSLTMSYARSYINASNQRISIMY